ncbi:DegV family protein [Jeongeupia chitinilytica]|uniref:DegV domain-containing protein n=1 Tax=Jeongeupia chitinilytica TaxID=1041641 RepID=A0ABQ3H455_9NEIS|nr:DegV family protein [Jeongeupia chitinilytica]GHD69527.1 DegV domain-containing protein [Jeongeupia chitinilytica]
MRIGVVTDSCCDLPRDFIDAHGIEIMPIAIQGDGTSFIDHRDPAATRAFYRDALQLAADFTSAPLTIEQIRALFLDRLVVDFDYVFCITVMNARSRIFDNASQAARGVLTDYRPIREAAGHAKPFSLRVFDSQNLFPGQGLIVAEVARLAAEGATTSRIIAHIERLTQTTQAFLIPADLTQLRHQARRKGDKSVGLAAYLLGSALDIKPVIRGYQGDTHPVAKVRGFDTGVDKLFATAIAHIEAGLDAPLVCVSYGGDTRVVNTMNAYQIMCKVAARHGVKVHLAEMSTTAGVNIGAGGLAIAFASPREATID